MVRTTNKNVKKVIKPKIETRVLTQEDLDTNPQLVEDGLKVGDEVEMAVYPTEKDAHDAEEEDATGEDATEPAEEVDAEEEEENDEEAVDIINGSRYIRQYSKKLHGKNYQALAEEFITKKPKIGVYEIVPASEIVKVEVRYREKLDAELHIDKQKPDAPMVDKVKMFTDKNEAVRFSSTKRNSSVVISRDGRVAKKKK